MVKEGQVNNSIKNGILNKINIPINNITMVTYFLM
jgi:hypothetical protein